jgi:membrane glycosyltransferase
MLDRSAAAASAGAEVGLPVVLRRVLFFALVAVTSVAMLLLAAFALSPGGLDGVDLLLLVMLAATLPWQVTGFWNSTIGILIAFFSRNPVAALFPGAARIRGDEAVTAKTAILVCIRNEVPDRVIRNLTTLMIGLSAAREGDHFAVYALSDTTDSAIAEMEEKRFNALSAETRSGITVTYRRRSLNTGFKAGNIRDFCDRWGTQHDFALVLDADSFMSADAVLRLVRVMQANPTLGILQSLVVGMPSTSAFARLFQFGMRLGMRSYTIGSAWWQADCGPYWGHNALIRVAPFTAHCHLPEESMLGQFKIAILSHDQIEAVLMRRAGYEVRVLAEEDGSWEENPATLLEFMRRDLRWCQGNMQYWHLLALPGIKLTSRYQLTFAIMMFIGSPGWIGLLILGTAAVAAAQAPAAVIRWDAGIVLFVLCLAMWVWPKFTTFVHVLTHSQERKAFGGGLRLIASMTCETVFSIMLAPIMWFGHTLFLVRLPFTRTVNWSGQLRDDHTVPWGLACQALWPHTLLGTIAIGALAATHPSAILYALPLAGGPALSIPLAVLTARRAVGAAMVSLGVGRLPEETAAPASLRALALPAIAARPSST